MSGEKEEELSRSEEAVRLLGEKRRSLRGASGRLGEGPIDDGLCGGKQTEKMSGSGFPCGN